jgi:hypothetical protein
MSNYRIKKYWCDVNQQWMYLGEYKGKAITIESSNIHEIKRRIDAHDADIKNRGKVEYTNYSPNSSEDIPF